MILAEEARTYSSVVDGYKPVVIICLLSVLAMVHIAQIILLTLEKDYCKSVQCQGTSNVIV